jgi:phage tail-like protein
MTRTSENDDLEPSGLSRRDLLKYGAAAGDVAGALRLGFRPNQAEAGPPERDAHERATKGIGSPVRFKVDIPGLPETSANVVSVDIEPIAIDVKEPGIDKPTTGADWDYRVYGPGDAHYGNITIRARVGKDSKELYAWWLDAARGSDVRKDITVVVEGQKGDEARRFNILECFPTRWDAGDYSPSSNVATETVVCKMQRVELA